MKRSDFLAIVSVGLLALLVCARAQSKLPQTPDGAAWVEPEVRAAALTAEETIKRWPAPAERVARVMLAKYGPPTRYGEDSLIWLHNGPWEKTVAYRDGWPQYKNQEEQDYLKQVIGYRVPEAKVEPILKFDPRVEVDSNTNELAARSGSERVNFLLLNLTDDIVTEKRGAEEAREFYEKTLQLAAAGKSSPYLEGFLFQPPNEKTVVP
jgi:hypothetical protein